MDSQDKFLSTSVKTTNQIDNYADIKKRLDLLESLVQTQQTRIEILEKERETADLDKRVRALETLYDSLLLAFVSLNKRFTRFVVQLMYALEELQIPMKGAYFRENYKWWQWKADDEDMLFPGVLELKRNDIIPVMLGFTPERLHKKLRKQSVETHTQIGPSVLISSTPKDAKLLYEKWLKEEDQIHQPHPIH